MKSRSSRWSAPTRILVSFLSVGLMLALPISAHAGLLNLLLEHNEDRDGGEEIALVEYGSLGEFWVQNFPSFGFSSLDVGSSFSVGGLAHDGSKYQLLLESDDDQPSGDEVFLAEFDSFSDLTSGTIATSGFSQIDIGPRFSVGGLAYTGTNFQLLLESDEDRLAGEEVFLVEFASITDLLLGNTNEPAGRRTQIDVGASFSIGGFAYDGSSYQVVLESDEDQGAAEEVFLAEYSSLGDLVSGSVSNSGFSQLNVGPVFGVGGFAYELDTANAVPAPGTLLLLMSGLLGFRRLKYNR